MKTSLAVGDLVDLALSPENVDGSFSDGSDGSFTKLVVSLCAAGDADVDDVCDDVDNCPQNFNPGQEDTNGDGIGDACDPAIALSTRDWSTSGTQGENGWSNGYFNLTLDGDGSYAVGDFIPFANDGSNVVSDPTNHWDGSAYRLTSDPGATGGPWTFLGKTDLHPNGTNSTPRSRAAPK